MVFTRKYSFIIQIAFFALVSLDSGYAKIVDSVPKERTVFDQLLLDIEPALEQGRLDIRFGVSSELTEKQYIERPQLTYLENLPLPKNALVNSHYFADLFGSAVTSSILGQEPFLAAVGGVNSTSKKSIAEFNSAWKTAALENRIFVSFSSQNFSEAKILAEELSKHNYSVYTYRAEADGKVWSTSIDAGRYFAEAGVRLVLDSPYSRSSTSTMVERIVFEQTRDKKIRRGSPSALNAGSLIPLESGRTLQEKFTLVTEESSNGKKNCCRICYRVNFASASTVSSFASKCVEVLQRIVNPAARNSIGKLTCGRIRCGMHCSNAQ